MLVIVYLKTILPVCLWLHPLDNLYKGKAFWMVFIALTARHWIFLEFTAWMKAQFWTCKRHYLWNVFLRVKYYLSVWHIYSMSTAIHVKIKKFYHAFWIFKYIYWNSKYKNSKGIRYSTSNLFWNTVTFQSILTTEGKKITLCLN